jgi:hypothetical protein
MRSSLLLRPSAIGSSSTQRISSAKWFPPKYYGQTVSPTNVFTSQCGGQLMALLHSLLRPSLVCFNNSLKQTLRALSQQKAIKSKHMTPIEVPGKE